jgi:7-cyano-7-deazaguanine synthase
MCAIVGALVNRLVTERELNEANLILKHIWSKSVERGRDGRGYIHISESRPAKRNAVTSSQDPIATPRFHRGSESQVIIGNFRAEPTTEFVAEKHEYDQQPYTLGKWSIVHNGTIANDTQLRTSKHETNIDSAAIVEQIDLRHAFIPAIAMLEGSYAILAAHEGRPSYVYIAANYRPIWYVETDFGVFFASARHYFPQGYVPKMFTPYSAGEFHFDGMDELVYNEVITPDTQPTKALVVCSGGLDSVVSAVYAKNVMMLDVELIHFMYGSRAEGPEVKAVQAVAEHLGVKLTLFPLPIYSPLDSPLLDPNSVVAGGEAGAEFAHEWVPARNLVLLSVATAFAEARGMDCIVLGNNLEEAGAYPDNEPEFIAKFNDLLPFAVGDGKRMQVIMPVGNMMKHEIVELGLRINAPLHLTWSCYRAGELHCGTCGPCYMRRKAFAINKAQEVINYKDEK